jgi:hypothetical protein
MRSVTIPRDMLRDELPRGPNALAKVCEEQIAELEARKAAVRRTERRRSISTYTRCARGLTMTCEAVRGIKW